MGQLDVAIREHKLEMQRKVESLQQSLEATERRLRDAQRDLLDKNNQESSQLLVHQQRLEAAVLESEETLRRCEALSSELDVIRLQKKDTV